jgi:type VI secretion system lysozyme-like protein
MDLLQKLNPNHIQSKADEVISIRDHLQKLLNSRKNLLPHIPNYGLSDFASLERKRGVIAQLSDEIEKAILTFEPRILRVELHPDRDVPELYRDFVAVFHIRAVLRSDPRGGGIAFSYKIRLDGTVEEDAE